MATDHSIDSPLTHKDIPWHSEPITYRAPDRPLTAPELWTLTELEQLIADHGTSWAAAWILDLLSDRAALSQTLHAACDQLQRQIRTRRER